MSFQLVEHVGYRLMDVSLGGDMALAPTVSLGLSQAFGDGGLFLLGFDAQAGADLRLWTNGDLEVLVTPTLGLGVGVVGASTPLGNVTEAAFHLAFAAQAELVLAEGLLGVFLRPVAFDFFIASTTLSSYLFLGGVNVRIG